MPDHTTGKWQVQDSNSNVSLQNTHCTPVKYVVLIVMLSFFLKLEISMKGFRYPRNPDFSEKSASKYN